MKHLLCCFLLALTIPIGSVPAQPSKHSGQFHTRVLHRPVSASPVPGTINARLEFIPNRGQLADQFGKPMPAVIYTLDGHGVRFYFTETGLHYVFGKYPHHSPSLGQPSPQSLDSMAHADSVMLYRVDVSFAHANKHPLMEAMDSSGSFYNYYLPPCPNGITHVPGYRQIIYRDLYPRVDLVLYTSGREQGVAATRPSSQEDPNTENAMECDFIVHPGGDPSQIELRYDHADSLALNRSGCLRFVTPYGEMSEASPVSYQTTSSSGTRAVSSRFVLHGNSLGFSLGRYDPSRDLTIDPPRLWGTYFGGSGSEYAYTIGVDRHNNVDLAGYTTSASGIATAGAYMATLNSNATNAYIASFGPLGNLRWATYYGGNTYDWVYHCACDSSCGLVIAGWTESTTGLASPGAYQTSFGGGTMDGFIASFDSTGMRKWGTWFGGPGYDYCWGVAVDSSGNIVVGGMTLSKTGIATAGAYQSTLLGTEAATISKFTPGGSLMWSTYYGGTLADGWARVGCDKACNIYASTYAGSPGLATPGAWQTAQGPTLFSKFTPAGGLVWATYYPSNTIYDIAVGRTGDFYFCGYDDMLGDASPAAYQTAPAGDYDGVLGRFDPSGQRVWCTYYGGPLADYLYSVGVDTDENVVAAGYTASTSGIASPGEYQTAFLGTTYDPMMIKFDSAGNRRWGTYYGREGYIYGMSIDRFGHPAVCGYTSTATNVFASPGAFIGSPPGAGDAFVARFCDTLEILVSVTPSKYVCPGIPVTLSAGAGLTSYQWSLNGTSIAGATASTYIIPGSQPPGTYYYLVTGTPSNSNVCEAASYPVRIVRGGASIKMAQAPSLCRGSSVRLIDTISGPGLLHYAWSPATGLDHPDSAQPLATPLVTTAYTLSVTDSVGCVTTAMTTVTVNALPTVTTTHDTILCKGSTLQIAAMTSGGTAPFSFVWSPATGLDRTDSSVVIVSAATSTTYVVTVTDNSGCSVKDSLLVTVAEAPSVSAGPPLSICAGSSIKIPTKVTGALPYSVLWSPAAGLSSSSILQPVASPNVTTLYTVTVRNSAGCTAQDTIRVIVSDSLEPTVMAAGPLSICTGDTVHLSTSPGYSSYLWSNGQKTPAISLTKTGDYYVRVSNATGCSGTSQVVHVTVLPDSLPHPILFAASRVICEGDSILISLIGSYATYTWSTGETTPTIFAAKSGAYSVTVTNSAGCPGTSAPMALTVQPRPKVQLSASGATTFCSGDSVTIVATPGYHYRWWNASTPLPDSTSSLNVKSSGTYFVVATSDAGCDTTLAPLLVTVTPTPIVAIVGPSSLCSGETAGYRIQAPAGSTIQWQLNPGSLGAITAGPGPDSITIEWGNSGSGTLSVSVTDHGCPGKAQLQLTIGAQLVPVITASGPLAFCDGDSVSLDAGASYATYQWQLNGVNIPGATAERLIVHRAGSYSVLVTNSGSCFGSSKASTITVYPTPPMPTITQAGNVLTSSAANSYQWSVDGSEIGGATNQSHQPAVAGAYRVTILDSNGCSNTSDPYIYEDSGATVVIVPPLTRAAPGDRVTIPLDLISSTNFALSGATHFIATLRFTSSLLASTGATPVGVMQGTDRLVTISGVSAVPPTATSGTISTLDFIATLGIDTCTPVTIDNFRWTDGRARVTTENGEFCLDGVCLAGGRPRLIDPSAHVSLSEIRPNPSSESVEIEYQIAEEGPTRIVLQDFLGRTALVVRDSWMTPGAYRETVSVSAIASGAYRVVLRTPSDILTKRMEVLK